MNKKWIKKHENNNKQKPTKTQNIPKKTKNATKTQQKRKNTTKTQKILR